jgi:hypothetical protein
MVVSLTLLCRCGEIGKINVQSLVSTYINSYMKLCEYGCNQPAQYVMTNGKRCCSKSYQSCVAIKNKNSLGLSKAHAEGRMPTDQFDGKRGWAKGLTAESDERVKSFVESRKKSFEEGNFQGPWKGKELPEEMKKKISEARLKLGGSRKNLYKGVKTTLYYIRISENLYKIGITSRSLQKRYSADQIKEVLFTKEYEDGLDAWNIERKILIDNMHIRYSGDPILHNGNTEILTKPIDIEKYI